MKENIQKLSYFYSNNKRMPSYAEMMKLFGFKSKNAVFGVVNKLVEKGILARDGRRLIPVKLFGEVKILGTVQAGFPTPAEEELIDTMTLDEWLIEKKEATYLLTVSGDSMKDAGILPGDVVLVERTSSPQVGQIVIAEVDGKWTIKFLKKKGNIFYLQPANKKYKDIYPKEEMRIEAVVKAVIRKY